MMDDRSFDELISSALSRRGEPAPFDVDVADRVMNRVAVLGAPRRFEFRYFMRWAAAVAIFGVASIGAAAWSGVTLHGMVTGLGLATAAAAGTAGKLVAPMTAVAQSFGRLFTALAGSVQAVIQPLAAFQPLVRLLLVALTAGMLAFTTFIVGRDIRSRVSDGEHA